MLEPGSTIGILGVGQLGRMLASAAAKLGFKTAVYGPSAETSPAGQVAGRCFTGEYEDEDAVRAFAEHCDAVTYEFENVPAATAAAVTDTGTTLAPNAKALAASQERLREKDLFRSLNIGTVPYWAIENEADLSAALPEAGRSILKTRRFGYDGKGQERLNGDEDAGKVLSELGGGPWILEGMASFDRELSQVAARSAKGEIAFFDLCENQHKDGILARSVIPAEVSAEVASQAREAVRLVLEHLDYVGVLTVEFFDVGGELLANEMAPRVHNSGHHTLEACSVSQFEQQIRAVAGWPLRDPETVRPMEMLNLVGAEADEWAALAADPNVDLTLYGKGEARPGRKMGHAVRPWRKG
ncbi:5-(carboxyamino)imidazole ribonucleotide synthase [Parvularcula sp. ZS-1/3]|uniref:N5-carboxyaminoimidazole ribonucleotide synthase n=1 Tax=Parvularcula mediterranea TaxID=2732508 RepID=A0A7Y3W643_9PROT|nr:5-(carboxyamino)imidazole ribonucleotide synthase [Parvularcula mediterranea]NNU16911.1 5-(carboxyamino)imidazole ribonucleotide synthase [Parvularcula mediterranea]